MTEDEVGIPLNEIDSYTQAKRDTANSSIKIRDTNKENSSIKRRVVWDAMSATKPYLEERKIELTQLLRCHGLSEVIANTCIEFFYAMTKDRVVRQDNQLMVICAALYLALQYHKKPHSNTTVYRWVFNGLKERKIKTNKIEKKEETPETGEENSETKENKRETTEKPDLIPRQSLVRKPSLTVLINEIDIGKGKLMSSGYQLPTVTVDEIFETICSDQCKKLCKDFYHGNHEIEEIFGLPAIQINYIFDKAQSVHDFILNVLGVETTEKKTGAFMEVNKLLYNFMKTKIGINTGSRIEVKKAIALSIGNKK
jgi:hypothetical protein